MKIVIWTGPAWETWGPDSIEKGIGGSEIAALHVSAGLAALGHEVEVLGQVVPGTWRGVKFTSIGQPRPGELLADEQIVLPASIECDVFVSSRQLRVLPLVGERLKARRRVLWMHDVHAGPDPEDRVGEYDDVFCLSRWAADTFKRYYPNTNEAKIVLTRNGIDPERFFLKEPVKDGFSSRGEASKYGPLVVYSSSPDRGLDKLLDYWPEVRRMSPDACLWIFYGFDTWEKMALRRGDRVAQLQIQILSKRLEAMAKQGVWVAGRAGQHKVAEAYMRAAMWLYPTDFKETSCITAMEAQAAGCDVVCTRLAALVETVNGNTGYMVAPPNQLRRYREEFLGCAEDILKQDRDDRGMTHNGREAREAAVERFPWSGVAGQWEEHFQEKLR